MKRTLAALSLTLLSYSGLSSALVAEQPLLLAASNPSSELSTSTALAPPAKPQPTKSLTWRWLELDNFSHAERYRNAFAVGDTHDFEGAQARSLIEGKVKLDSKGRYDIGFRASSGRYFNWAYSNYTGQTFISRIVPSTTYLTPAETFARNQAIFADPSGLSILRGQIRSNGWEFYMRELYASATPVKQITVEFGSFGFERGYSTEITTFDDDGYISGERIRFRDPKHLFFDQVGYTNAFFGDIQTVNLFARGLSLGSSNYHQVFAKKKLNSRLAFSGEYTRQLGIDTLRQAAIVQTGASKVADSVRVEVYERLNSYTFAGAAHSPLGPIPAKTVDGGSGFAVAINKKVGRLSGDIGFATVDSDYSVYPGYRFIHAVGFALNGDTYGSGNRPFVHASLNLAPGVSAFGFYTHEVGGTRVLTLNQQGLNAGMTFDFKALINQEKRIF